MINDKKVFIFDLDGVIINTVEFLYNSYLKFLLKYKINGSKEEFNMLNGPKIEDIIIYLKTKYKIKESESHLLEEYNGLINSAYNKAEMVSGIEKILKIIKIFNLDIALATSSSKKNVEFILKKFDLSHYFKVIVYGDDVSEAKPSPLIYNLVRDKMPAKSYYVIEDSVQGVIAAKAAGMKIIFFNRENKKANRSWDYQVSRTDELMNIIVKLITNIDILSVEQDLKLVVVNQPITDSQEKKDKVNIIWEEKKKNNSSFYEGNILRGISVERKGKDVILLCSQTEYKYYLAKFIDSSLGFKINPIAISGLITDNEGYTLIGKRRKVTSHAGHYELVPSGGVDSVEFRKQIIKEFKEETGFDEEIIKRVDISGLIFDNTESLYEIIFNIHISKSLNLLLPSLKIGEYEEFEVIKLSEFGKIISNYEFVPLSKLIYALIDN